MWWRTAIAAVAAIAAGTILVVVAHRYLTSAATHITTFSEHTGGSPGCGTSSSTGSAWGST